MEDYRNPDDPLVIEPDEQAEMPEEQVETEEILFDEPEPKPVEVQSAPKKKKKKSFKRRLKRALRRFFKLPLVTRCIAIAIAILILAGIITLLVVLPKNCAAKADKNKGAETVETEAPEENTPEPTAEQIPTKEPVPTATAIPVLPSTALKLNDSDPIIPYIRSRLVELGYMEMPATNDELYDQATFNAVRRFQYRNFTDNVKDWDGYIGQKTYDKMFASDVRAFFIKSGDTDAKLYDGELVTKMQMQLVALGYLKTATGNCDKTTVEAIRQFQKKNSLTSDGVAGLSTLNLLKQMTADSANAGQTTETEPMAAETTEGTAEEPATSETTEGTND